MERKAQASFPLFDRAAWVSRQFPAIRPRIARMTQIAGLTLLAPACVGRHFRKEYVVNERKEKPLYRVDFPRKNRRPGSDETGNER